MVIEELSNRWIENTSSEHCDQLIWRRHRFAAHIYCWVVAFFFFSVPFSFSVSLSFSTFTVFDSLKYFLLPPLSLCSFTCRYWCEEYEKEMKWENDVEICHLSNFSWFSFDKYVCTMLNRTWCMCSITHICKKSNKTQSTKDIAYVRNHYVWSWQ